MQCKDDVSLDKTAALKICESMGQITSDSLIPILQKIQDAYGYLPAEILLEVSKRTGLPVSRMYGVATFYTACHVKGGREITGAIERELGVQEGETTEDMRFTFETVACLGTCFLAPVVMINNDYFGNVSTSRIKTIIKRYE